VSLTSTVLRLHQLVYERSGGRLGHGMVGVPTLLLRTTGARTAATRTNALVYAKDGENYVVVASKGGADQSPGWFFNVRANPDVELQVGQRKLPGSARIVDHDDEDYARLWRLVNDNNHGRYDAYQTKTSRPIPLIVVAPK
jgi:deazaflavin-dependent oxidoreductase (nitroreductase family)